MKVFMSIKNKISIPIWFPWMRLTCLVFISLNSYLIPQMHIFRFATHLSFFRDENRKQESQILLLKGSEQDFSPKSIETSSKNQHSFNQNFWSNLSQTVIITNLSANAALLSHTCEANIYYPCFRENLKPQAQLFHEVKVEAMLPYYQD